MLWALLAGLALGACSGEGPAPAQGDDAGPADAGRDAATSTPGDGCQLSTAAAWAFVADESLDPFAARRPRVAACGEGAIRPLPTDPTQLELELATCRLRYASVDQPALCEGHAGDELSFELHHLMLVSASGEPAEAYLALAIDGDVLWEATLPIPADEATYPVSLRLPRDFDIGAQVVLHVDNHGENSYEFSPMLLQPAAP